MVLEGLELEVFAAARPVDWLVAAGISAAMGANGLFGYWATADLPFVRQTL